MNSHRYIVRKEYILTLNYFRHSLKDEYFILINANE
jgi:hypothetical protein